MRFALRTLFRRPLITIDASQPISDVRTLEHLASLAVVLCLLLGSALVASFLPAWRALGIDPMTALRQE